MDRNIRRDGRPIRPSTNGRYNMNFIDWNNEWERVGEIEQRIEAGEEISDSEEENRVREYLKKTQEKSGCFIETFPLITIRKAQKGKECYICLKQFALGSKARKLPCAHLFCEGCLKPWIKTNLTCPTCKANLRQEPEAKEIEGTEYF